MRCDRYRCDIQRMWRRRNSAEPGELRCYVLCNASLVRLKLSGPRLSFSRTATMTEMSAVPTANVDDSGGRRQKVAILFRLSEALRAP